MAGKARAAGQSKKATEGEKDTQEPPSTPEKPTESRSRSKAAKNLNVSGSDWTEEHLKAFTITFKSKSNLWLFLQKRGISLEKRLRDNVQQLLKSSIGQGAQYSSMPHARLFQQAQGVNVQFGPFLAFIAMVSQAWRETGEIGGRKSARTANFGLSDAYITPKAYLTDTDETLYETPIRQKLPLSPEDFEPTPQHVAVRQEKPEIVSNTMAVLFLQAVLESCRDSSSSPESEPCYLEWHFIPRSLSVASLRASCRSINDGSLFRKHWQPNGDDEEWVNADNLVYTSLEAKAKYGLWQDHGHEQTPNVKAQEASQMIGMICERIKASNHPLKTEYDRTTFLIACTATSMVFKYATFSQEYIRHYGLGQSITSTLAQKLDKPASDKELVKEGENLPAAVGEQNAGAKQSVSQPPTLTIYESKQYSLRNSREATEAAEYSLAILAYLQKHGPLLANATG